MMLAICAVIFISESKYAPMLQALQDGRILASPTDTFHPVTWPMSSSVPNNTNSALVSFSFK